LPQAGANRPNKHLAPPLGTPDDVVHHEVDAVTFACIVYVDSILLFNTARQVEGPFIPPKAGAFWPLFCKRR
jgi:hypothetical protein